MFFNVFYGLNTNLSTKYAQAAADGRTLHAVHAIRHLPGAVLKMISSDYY